jgi:hypothetical protein
MVNYANGKIYKVEPIIDHDEGDIYIGSTTKKLLSQRMDAHRADYKRWKNGKRGKIMSFDIFEKYGIQNCVIILLELVNVKSKDELQTREKYYIQSMNCVNKSIPMGTLREWTENNKDKILEKQRQYNEKNKDKITEQQREYYIDNKDKISQRLKQYREDNKETIKLYYIDNKDKILERQKVKCTCECGIQYTHTNKARHNKGKKHMKYLEQNK